MYLVPFLEPPTRYASEYIDVASDSKFASGKLVRTENRLDRVGVAETTHDKFSIVDNCFGADVVANEFCVLDCVSEHSGVSRELYAVIEVRNIGFDSDRVRVDPDHLHLDIRMLNDNRPRLRLVRQRHRLGAARPVDIVVEPLQVQPDREHPSPTDSNAPGSTSSSTIPTVAGSAAATDSPS